MIDFDLQNHKPLRDIVYNELKKKIITGEIAPNTRMMEVELAEDLGISRTPVREAMRHLESDGLVVIEPRKGAYASDLSFKKMLDVMQVREELDGLAAALAAEKMTDEMLCELEEINKGYSVAIEKKDRDSMIKYDELFHSAIVRFTGNEFLKNMVASIQESVLRFRYLYYAELSTIESMEDEHEEIIDALNCNDAEKARDEAKKHIQDLKEFIRDREEKDEK